ncbi:T9SS-dependent choice-of-anchor J family protein [Winogradskyella sediminis]|uniref:Por secretion system C-terminal sorting domain-containing protein n=1 Tax=Winogradskyella sediminis TaxID=1382466 RepID=A0A1H1WZF5_9FLAO|nr:choice-of-anchor J domain-containing protein [Winogradskyella sediminis]SDT01619.1 Por secretion system C-terminal sorting domain-containing protein [Winogradskyella sediminis]
MKFYYPFFTILLCIAATSLSFSQNVTITDTNFKNALLNHDPVIDTNSDGEIQVAEAEAYAGSLNVASSDIAELTGIESFLSITALNCSNNEIAAVDLTQNIALEKIEIAANELSVLDISQNSNLKELACNGNDLVELYTASNVNLEVLNVSANSISDLEIASNTALKSIEINLNPIENIDISNNVNLELFSATYCYNLNTVDFSNNNTLENILLWYTNQEEIDVSNMPNLSSLYLRSLNLTSLDVSNNPNLYSLYVTDNNISELDVSFNSSLAYLSLDGLYVSTVDVSNNPNLEWLDLSGFLLETVNAKNGNNTIFTYFNIDNASSLGTICVDDVTYANANFTKPSTSYFSEICSPDDCDSAAINYTQGFETTIQPFIEVCWRKYPLNSTNYNYVKTVSAAYTGNNSVGMRSISSGDALLITPELIDFDSNKRVSFWLYSPENSSLNVGTIPNPDDITTFEPYRTITINDGGGNQWRHIDVDFENYTGNANHVAFKLSGNYSFAYIDDFVYQDSPSCITPIDTEVITYANEASIDWLSMGSATSWDIEYGPEDFTPGSGTLINTTSKPYIIEGLDSNTVYDFFIRSRCSGSDASDWSFVNEFTTLCPALIADYTYNFEDGYSGEFYSCWEALGSGFLTQDGNTSASTGAIKISNYNEGAVVTPELFELNSSKRIKFWLKNEEGDSDLVIGTFAVQNDLSTFTPYQTISSSDMEEGIWEQIIIDFENYTGNDRFVGFKQVQIDNYADFYIDEFVYQSTPDCLEPQNFHVTALSDTSADLLWTNTNGVTDWEIQYGALNFELGFGTIISGTGDSTTINNLYPDSTYDIYIRSNCGGGSYSDWFKLQNIHTDCGPFYDTYTQNFDDSEFANCWSRLPGVDPEVYNTNIVDVSYSYPLGGSGKTIKFNDYQQNGELFLVSPEFSDLNNGNKRIKFWLHPRYNNANMVVGTMTDPTDANTFTAKETIAYTDMTYRDWKQFTINFNDYSGSDNYIAFNMQIEEEPIGGTSIIYLDRFEYSDVPTCQTPIDFTNTGISNGEIELSWNDENNASQWEILYGEEGFWYDDGTVIQVDSNPFSVSDLPTEIVYDFYVRAVCDASNSSDWSEKITVDIGCGQSYTTGYTYDFNSSTLDACWMAYEYSSNSYTTSFEMVIDNNFGDDGYSAYMEDTSAYSSYGVMMVSPLFTDLSNDKKIEFYISNYDGGLKVGTITNPEDYSTFETLETIDGSVEANVWEKRTVYLDDYNGTDQYLAFKYQRASSNNGSQVIIDDFSYLQSVLCEVPSDLTLEQVYDNSVDLSWGVGESDIEWELEFEQIDVYNSEETVIVTSNNFTLENLLEGTEYGIRVRAKCDEGGLYSDWSEAITFFTTCMPVEAYYFESFEFENAISPCWTKIVETDNTIINIYAVEDFNVNYNGVNRTLYPHSGNQFIQFSNSFDNAGGGADNLMLVSREILDIDNEKRIRLQLISRQGSSGSDYNRSSLHIGTMSDPNDSSTFTLVQTITPEEMNEYKSYEDDVVAWKEHTIYFNNYTGTDHYIAIKHGDEFVGSEFFVDDFVFEAIPDCTEPLYPIVLDERYDAVDVSWESYENSNPTSWEIEYGFSGFEIGTGTVMTASDSSFTTISNLVEDTDYDFYIRANCGSGYSDWSVKQVFTAKCAGFEVGYQEGFENHPTGFLEHCWTGLLPQVGSSYWDEIGQIRVYNNSAYNTPDAHTGEQAIWFMNETNHPLHDEVSEQSILVSPRLIDLDNYKRVSFWMYPISSAYATPTEIVIGTMTDPDDYTTFTPYYTITNAAENEDTWTQYEIDLSNFYLEDEYIGIRQAAINERQVILFDDFEYKEADCVTPTNLEATQTGDGDVTLAWQDNNTQQAPQHWEIEYGSIGFETGSGTLVEVDSNPFIISNLPSFSDYEYRVRAYCSEAFGYSDWSVPYAFTMTCAVQAPFYENFDQYDAEYQYAYNQNIPNFCWTRNDKQVSGIYDTESLVVSPSSSPNVGFINYYDSETSPLPGVMVSPYLSDFDANKILKIWVRNETTGSVYNQSGIIIGTMTNPLDSETFVPFTTIWADEIPLFGKEFLIDFATYTGDAHHIAIKHNEENDYSLVMFDDIEYKERPSCLEPISVDFMSVSDTSVSLVWENTDAGATFDVEYGVLGFTPGTGILVNTDTNGVSINGLEVETSYEFYVRTNCGISGVSEWVGPINATTACSVESIPWVENFDTMETYGQGILPNCFQHDDVWVSSNTNLSDYQVGDGDSSYLYAVFDEYGIEAYMITPLFSMEAGRTYTLSFKIRKEQGDYSFQSVKVWTGQGNATEALDNYINYFSEFSFGFYNYHTIETTFTPIVDGDYSFLLDFGYSSIIRTISVDSFSLEGEYEERVALENGEVLTYDFSVEDIDALILEETENTQCRLTSDGGEDVLMMAGGQDTTAWYNSGDSDLNWIENQNFISKVNFEVDASAVSELFMNFDLRQTFLTSNSESVFRIVVNGDVLEVFLADNATDYQNVEVDLSSYAGNSLRVSLQHLGKNRDDRAYLDNLSFGEESSLSVQEYLFSEFVFRPNPVKHNLFISNATTIDSVTIFDVTGRQLQTININANIATLDMAYLPSAMYFVEVEIGEHTKIIKVLKD